MRIVITGGSGLIGRRVVNKLLERRYNVTLLSRNPEKAKTIFPAARVGFWDVKTSDGLKEFLHGADAVVNLAGEPIAAKRWSKDQKQKILNSRVESTRAIVNALGKMERKPRILLNASAVGYYGDIPEGEVTEISPKGNGFLAGVCEKWEKEALNAESLGVRVALLRTGIVLDKNGGALKKLILPFHFFAGGVIGSGEQWMPWIHLDDAANAVCYIIENDKIAGPVNLSAPEPVRMKDFCRILGKILHRPSLTRVPAAVIKFVLGEMSGLLLEGQKVMPGKLIDAGFDFKFRGLEEALKDILDQ